MKTVSPTEDATLKSGAFAPCDLILIEIPSGNFGFWFGGLGTATYGSQSYVGCGDLLTTGSVDTSADGVINGYDLILSGIKPEDMALVEREQYHQKRCIRQTSMIGPDGVTLSDVRTVSSDRIDFIVRKDVPNAQLTVTIRGGSQLVKGRGGARRTDIGHRMRAFPIVDTFYSQVGLTGRGVRYWGQENPQRSTGTQGISGGGGGQGNRTISNIGGRS